MSLQDALKLLHHELEKLYNRSEAVEISNWLMEHITGLSRSRLLVNASEQLTDEQQEQLQIALSQLMNHVPLQYVIHEAWFCGLKFYVDNAVLIPRPETEELVEWIISNCKFPINKLRILDVGTGSGCIPIALKRKLRKADVTAIDISNAALKIAQYNAIQLGADIRFIAFDILKTSDRQNGLSSPQTDADKQEQLVSSADGFRDTQSAFTYDDSKPWNKFDIIVSNPPYIPHSHAATIENNVKDHEPALALFVPDDDPLLFYKAILEFAIQNLNRAGAVFLEIYEEFTSAIQQIYTDAGFNCEIKKDMQGKDRMLRCVKNE